MLEGLAEADPRVHAEAGRVDALRRPRSALCEALANAMLYGNRGDRSKTVDLRARYGPFAIEIHVTDEGLRFRYQYHSAEYIQKENAAARWGPCRAKS